MESTKWHPNYEALKPDYLKFRNVLTGGKEFVTRYLIKFSARESDTDYNARVKISYCVSQAKSALIEVKNAIYQRFIDINRSGGPDSYRRAIVTGVDKRHNSMNSFIGVRIILELIAMGKIGVFIDRDSLPQGATLAETNAKSPYLYVYQAEDILNWRFDNNDQLVAVLLQDHAFTYDDKYGLCEGKETRFRRIYLNEDGYCQIEIFKTGKDGHEEIIEEKTLTLRTIPFVIGELSSSLLTDIADYQIAMTNIASSDVNYTLKSNFPFYVEQFDPKANMSSLSKALSGNPDDPDAPKDGTQAALEAQQEDRTIKTGNMQGRRYPLGMNEPNFIAPPSGPLEASMKKQQQMKDEIHELINLSLSNIEPRRASAESRKQENQGKEEGLSYIGLELEYVEREIARIWAAYENQEPATVNYPANYSLKTDADRNEEAKTLTEQLPKIPSKTYQKETAKLIVDLTLGHKIEAAKLVSIYAEIDEATVIVADPDVIKSDLEAGLVSVETASTARGYPKGEVEKAKIDHAERLARIAESQAKGANGVTDTQTDPDQSKKEKEKLRTVGREQDPNNQDPTRGKGK